MTIPFLPEFDLIHLITTFGYVGLFAIVFAESGLFFGFFLPGDSLLFTAGLLASQRVFNIFALVPLLILAAVAGDSAGFWMGRKFGSWLMRQKDTLFFKRHHLLKAQAFYEKHGGKTLILARFMPGIRTFAPIVAGMANMKYERFISFNVIGGILWASAMSLLGYFLGSIIPADQVDKYLFPIIGAIVVISVIPAIVHMRADNSKQSKRVRGFSPVYKAKLLLSRVFPGLVG